MKRPFFSTPTCLTLTLGLFTALGCAPADRSPDAIRQDTAKATHEAVQDAKAVGQGVVEGLKKSGPVNLNKDSADRIATLPGITQTQAEKIVAARPYDSSDELVKRRLVSKDEYNKIADKVTTK
jgi:DNA uptake protein ComE-like DNA-binding protein